MILFVLKRVNNLRIHLYIHWIYWKFMLMQKKKINGKKFLTKKKVLMKNRKDSPKIISLTKIKIKFSVVNLESSRLKRGKILLLRVRQENWKSFPTSDAQEFRQKIQSSSTYRALLITSDIGLIKAETFSESMFV